MYQITNEGCVAESGKCDACTLTERNWESSWLRASVSLLVKTGVCTQTPLSSKRLKARARTTWIGVLGWWGVAPTVIPLRNAIKGMACVQTSVNKSCIHLHKMRFEKWSYPHVRWGVRSLVHLELLQHILLTLCCTLKNFPKAHATPTISCLSVQRSLRCTQDVHCECTHLGHTY